MHETALMRNLLHIAEKTLEENNVGRVKSVTLSLGKLSNAMPGSLSFAFKAMTRSGPLKGAELIIKEVPVSALCEICGAEYEPLDFPFLCPGCGSRYYTITQGEKIYIESLDCESE